MLVLSRKIGERIVIEPGIEISVVDVRGGRVRIGIAAPSSVGIRRMEVDPRRGEFAHATGTAEEH